MGNKTLLRLMGHTAVKAHIEPRVFNSLGYHGQVDHVIGAVEEAARMMPFDRGLQRDYRKLRWDEDFRLYFTGANNQVGRQERKIKNPAYKARNGF